MVELITSIAIIAVLAALILPAIQGARETSRNATCTSNLREIGIAVASYESTYKTLPVGATGGSSTGAVLFGILPRILGQLEMFEAASNIDWSASLVDQTEAFKDLTIGAVVRCPSDGNPSREGLNFVFNGGITCSPANTKFADSKLLGAFDLDENVLLSSFTDGLSSTVFFSERLFGTDPLKNYTDASSRADSRRGIALLHFPPDHTISVGQPNRMALECSGVARNHASWSNQFQRHWGYPWFFNAVAVPNAQLQDCGVANSFPIWSSLAARSNHSSSVNVLFGDNRIETLSNGINLETWRARVTRSGGSSESSN